MSALGWLASVAAVCFRVERRLPSLNDRVQNAGNSRWRYAQERDAWVWLFRNERSRLRIPPATGPRSLTVTRVYAGREKERDYVNLVGGCKAVIDALVLERLLVDDKPSMLRDVYVQRRAEPGEQSGTWFELADM